MKTILITRRLFAVCATLLLVSAPAGAADQLLGSAHVDTATGLLRFPGLASFYPCSTTSTITGILKGNGSAGCVAAAPGTDYVPPSQAATPTVLGLVKPDGTTITNNSGALSVNYGTAANTAAQGNDSRITGALQASAAALPSSFVTAPGLGAAPTGSAGPTATTGSASTYMRSDAAPAINLSSNYTWTGAHAFMSSVSVVNSNPPLFALQNTSAPTDQQIWRSYVDVNGVYHIQATKTDATAGTFALSIDRSGYSPVTMQLMPGGGTVTAPTPAVSDNSTSVATTAVLQQHSAHVTNNAALLTWTNYAFPVVRDGFTTAGDGGDATYTYSASACAAADNGAQVTAANGNCWIADTSHGARVQLWGCKADGSTNNASCITTAVTALSSPSPTNNLSGTLIFPASTACYNVGSTITIQGSYLTLKGFGTSTCIKSTFAAGNIFQVGNGATYFGQTDNPFEVAFKDMTFSTSVTRTSGAAIAFYNTYNTTAENVTCYANMFHCVDVDGLGGQTQVGVPATGANDLDHFLNNVRAPLAGVTGICIGCNHGLAANIFIEGGEFGNQSSAAIELRNAGGVVIHKFNSDGNYHALWAHPLASSYQQVAAVYASDDYFDVSTAEGVLFDATAGLIADNRFSDVWIESCGTSGTPSSCFLLNGTASTLLGNVFNVRVLNAWGHGIQLNGGTSNQFSGEISQNDLAGASGGSCVSHSYDGFIVAAGVTHFSWSGSIGGRTGLPLSINPNCQGYGLHILAGSSDYYTVSGDLSGNVTAGIFDGGTGTHKLDTAGTNFLQ